MDKIHELIDALNYEFKISNTREYDFSVKQLFEMFSNPVYLKQWFWPKWFTNTFEKFDFKANWERTFVMHGPDWVDYQNKCLFLKIVENEFIAREHLSIPNFQINVRFTKISENKTKLDFIMLFFEKNVFEGVSKFAPEKNEENLDKLGDLMKKTY